MYTLHLGDELFTCTLHYLVVSSIPASTAASIRTSVLFMVLRLQRNIIYLHRCRPKLNFPIRCLSNVEF
jgi:hypothetical protein